MLEPLASDITGSYYFLITRRVAATTSPSATKEEMAYVPQNSEPESGFVFGNFLYFSSYKVNFFFDKNRIFSLSVLLTSLQHQRKRGKVRKLLLAQVVA